MTENAQKNQAEERFLEYLSYKYPDESFTIDRVVQHGPGGGGDYKFFIGYGHSESCPDLEFMVSYDASYLGWVDDYAHLLVEYRSKDEIHSKFEEIMDCEILAGGDFGLNLPELYTDPDVHYPMEGDFHTLIAENPPWTVSFSTGADVYVEGDFDIAAETTKIKNFMLYLKEQGFKECSLQIRYVKSEYEEAFRSGEINATDIDRKDQPQYYDEYFYSGYIILNSFDSEMVLKGFGRSRLGSPFYIEPEEQPEVSLPYETPMPEEPTWKRVEELGRSEGARRLAELRMSRKNTIIEIQGRDLSSYEEAEATFQKAFHVPRELVKDTGPHWVISFKDFTWLDQEVNTCVLYINNIHGDADEGVKAQWLGYFDGQILPEFSKNDIPFFVIWVE